MYPFDELRRAVLNAIATACLTGFPALTSVAMFLLTIFLLLPFSRGIDYLNVLPKLALISFAQASTPSSPLNSSLSMFTVRWSSFIRSR